MQSRLGLLRRGSAGKAAARFTIALTLLLAGIASAQDEVTTTSSTLAEPTTTTTLPAEIAPVPECGDPSGNGSIEATDAQLVLRASVGAAVDCHAMACDAVGGLDGVRANDALAVLRASVGLDAGRLRCPSAARLWMEELLGAIRRDIPRPTVHARNLLHLSIAMWDAWVAYDDETSAVPYLFAETPPALPDAHSARSIAISYASYRILSHRFVFSPGKVASQASFDAAMDELGLDRAFTSTAGDSPAAVGNRIAAAVIAHGLADGANEQNNYADNTGYQPVNEPLYPALSGTTMVDPNRWQPLSLEFSVTQNGIPLPISVQVFISPNWGPVTPFALEPVDPGPPPRLGGEGDAEYKASAFQVLRFSSLLDPTDGAMMNISPGAKGNNELGTNNGSGHPVNPATGAPYAPQIVKRADWARVLAEYWADGPKSETPPGHWNVLANYVADHPLFEKRIRGVGEILDNLQWDVKVYLAVNGAVHDAAISAWGTKAIYDSVRPISMIRYMSGRGQSSDPLGPSYDPQGLPLEAGLSEVITAESAAEGQRHAHLAEHIGEIAVRAWLGNPEHPATEIGGVGWILGIDWIPYQQSTFVTPAFAGYYSGHSTFSRAAAEALTAITGTPYFPGGLSEFHAQANEYLRFEEGPTTDIVLQWATYQDAADEAGLSRLYGGIHPRPDDFTGRRLGFDIGRNAAALARKYWDGTVGQ